MTIQYIEPFSRGIERMKKALFHPFDMSKWFVVGFTAFLSGLTECSGHGGSGGKSGRSVDWEYILYFPQKASAWLAENPVWATVIVIGAVLLLVLGIFIVWWSCRGKFMFLDNVVHDRSQVVAPWREFRSEGNSLFALSLSLEIILFLIVLGYLVRCITSLQVMYEANHEGTTLIVPAILMGLGLVAVLIVKGFIDLMLHDFVVPIMYKNRVNAWSAIQKFMPLFKSYFPYFLGYALFMFVVIVILVFGIVVAGLVTCCIGFVILAIPYINAVILLPISYTVRAFSVEFLAQFGPEYTIFPKQEPVPPDTQPVMK